MRHDLAATARKMTLQDRSEQWRTSELNSSYKLVLKVGGHARLQNDDPGSDPDPHVKVDHIGIHHPYAAR
jgi:hypothetical protein